MRKNGRTARKLNKFAWRFRKPVCADGHGVLLPMKYPPVSPRVTRQVSTMATQPLHGVAPRRTGVTLFAKELVGGRAVH
jgi:hypothetical protein